MNDSVIPPSMGDVPPPSPYAAPAVPGGDGAGGLSVMSNEEKTWAGVAHFSSLCSLIPMVGILGSVAGPLIVFLVKKDSMPFATQEAKEALNFNITWAIGTTVLWVATVLLMAVLVGFLLLPVAIIAHLAWVVLPIVGGLRALEGKPYRYPFTLRLIE